MIKRRQILLYWVIALLPGLLLINCDEDDLSSLECSEDLESNFEVTEFTADSFVIYEASINEPFAFCGDFRPREFNPAYLEQAFLLYLKADDDYNFKFVPGYEQLVCRNEPVRRTRYPIRITWYKDKYVEVNDESGFVDSTPFDEPTEPGFGRSSFSSEIDLSYELDEDMVLLIEFGQDSEISEPYDCSPETEVLLS